MVSGCAVRSPGMNAEAHIYKYALPYGIRAASAIFALFCSPQILVL
jgi:hypothetical protein